MFNVITNHYQQAVARLMSQYQQAENLQNFMAAIIQPIQDIEYVLNDMNVLRQLSVATGQQLDNIGIIVGLPRPAGADDTQYRMDLYAIIGVNISEGQPEQAIHTFQLFTDATLVLFDEFFPAEIVIESSYVFPDQAAVDAMIHLMQQVLPAGVRCDGFIEFDSSNPFSFDGNLPGGGFGDSSSPLVGGLFSTLRLRDGQFAFEGSDSTAEGFGSSNDPLVGGEFVT